MSKENRPVGSVSDASMSPRSSLTTNVLPSRILTTSSLTCEAVCFGSHVEPDAVSEGREEPLEEDEQPRVALDGHGAAQHGRERVHLTGRHPREELAVGP